MRRVGWLQLMLGDSKVRWHPHYCNYVPGSAACQERVALWCWSKARTLSAHLQAQYHSLVELEGLERSFHQSLSFYKPRAWKGKEPLPRPPAVGKLKNILDLLEASLGSSALSPAALFPACRWLWLLFSMWICEYSDWTTLFLIFFNVCDLEKLCKVETITHIHIQGVFRKLMENVWFHIILLKLLKICVVFMLKKRSVISLGGCG